MNKNELTGTQLLYAVSRDSSMMETTEGKCRICGGPLLLPVHHASGRSTSWTDENICRVRDSDYYCAACHWFTQGKNRRHIWEGKRVLAAADALYHLTYQEFFQFLIDGFETPAVFLLRGTDPMITQKHIQWRAIDAVTYTTKKTRVVFAGLQAFKGSKIDGLAEFELSRFLAMVQELQRKATDLLLPTLQHMKSEWQKRNTVFLRLVETMDQSSMLTPANYLGAFLAAYNTVPEPEKEERNA